MMSIFLTFHYKQGSTYTGFNISCKLSDFGKIRKNINTSAEVFTHHA